MSKETLTALNNDGLILSGYQKKLKTMKRKFFVIYKTTSKRSARLEYYDNEKKFKAGLSPKRIIKLENCFNVNRRLDTKNEFVIALSTNDGSFGIVLDNENEMLKWFEVLLTLQRPNSTITDIPRPKFDHVWQVNVQKKGLAEEKGILGSYHVCLKSKSITFIRIGLEKSALGEPRATNIEIPLNTIRRCGDSQCFFYMEVGRQSTIGPGELWMEAEETMIAQNMHKMISSAMSAKIDTHMEPMRKRSSSATETSKPMNIMQGKPFHLEKKIVSSVSGNISYGRERCDSFPSRNYTTGDQPVHNFSTTSCVNMRSISSGQRSQSYQRRSSSPPICSTIGCSESEESSVSIDEPDDAGNYLPYRFHSRSSAGVILEENLEELAEGKSNNCNNPKSTNLTDKMYISMAPVQNQMDMGELIKMGHLKKNSQNDVKSVPSTNSLNFVRSSGTDFQEYSSDTIFNTLGNPNESQLERPTRAYSFGNTIEHNRLNNRQGNPNNSEHNTIRARAFSVGSRAKIPRCDLQRAVLFPKSLMEQNFHSNNNLNLGTDVIGCKQILKLNTIRNKKSTSAPILTQKVGNCMSDLMEIDFSNRSYCTHNHTCLRIPQTLKKVPSISRDLLKEQGGFVKETQSRTLEDISQSLPSIKSVSKVDNGYLEMKPVACSFNEKTTTPPNEVNASNVLYSAVSTNRGDNENFTKSHSKQENIVEKQNTVLNAKNDERILAQRGTEISNDLLINSNESVQNFDNDSNLHALSSQYSELTLLSNKTHEIEKINKNNISKTKQKDNSSPKYKYNKNDGEHNVTASDKRKRAAFAINQEGGATKQISSSNESVSEEFRNKGNNSLEICNTANRSTLFLKENLLRDQLEKNQHVSVPEGIVSNNKFTSALFINGVDIPRNTILINSNSLNLKTKPSAQSGVPAVKAEQKLYYASLDLPQCSKDINMKLNKIDCNISSVIENDNNSYAKIDFDHSSDSSSSSKNFNM